jgi:hypothetical protein
MKRAAFSTGLLALTPGSASTWVLAIPFANNHHTASTPGRCVQQIPRKSVAPTPPHPGGEECNGFLWNWLHPSAWHGCVLMVACRGSGNGPCVGIPGGQCKKSGAHASGLWIISRHALPHLNMFCPLSVCQSCAGYPSCNITCQDTVLCHNYLQLK